MFGVENSGSALDTIAHVIQVALTQRLWRPMPDGIGEAFTILTTEPMSRCRADP